MSNNEPQPPPPGMHEATPEETAALNLTPVSGTRTALIRLEHRETNAVAAEAIGIQFKLEDEKLSPLYALLPEDVMKLVLSLLDKLHRTSGPDQSAPEPKKE